MNTGYSVPFSLFIMIIVIYCVRMLPMILLRRNIKSPFIRSFLHYVPYVTLSVMTFPAILSATGNLVSGLAALVVGVLAAYFSGDLFLVAVLCCASAYITSFI